MPRGTEEYMKVAEKLFEEAYKCGDYKTARTAVAFLAGGLGQRWARRVRQDASRINEEPRKTSKPKKAKTAEESGREEGNVGEAA